MTREEIKVVLEQHLLCIRSDGKEGRRADLSKANLSKADLSGADLSRANLSGADLSGADLSKADLSGADLFRADLSKADLSKANLSGADLSKANLSGADLSGADLSKADLTVIWNKYVCHLSWRKNGTTCIRIGCQCLPVAEYEEKKEALADELDRPWWDEHGTHIFEFLKAEAAREDAKKAEER